MATYVDILKSEFPEIDTEVFDYITGEWFRLVYKDVVSCWVPKSSHKVNGIHFLGESQEETC